MLKMCAAKRVYCVKIVWIALYNSFCSTCIRKNTCMRTIIALFAADIELVPCEPCKVKQRAEATCWPDIIRTWTDRREEKQKYIHDRNLSHFSEMTHQTPAGHKDEDTNLPNWGNQNVMSILKSRPSSFHCVETVQVFAQLLQANILCKLGFVVIRQRYYRKSNKNQAQTPCHKRCEEIMMLSFEVEKSTVRNYRCCIKETPFCQQFVSSSCKVGLPR